MVLAMPDKMPFGPNQERNHDRIDHRDFRWVFFLTNLISAVLFYAAVGPMQKTQSASLQKPRH